MKFKTKFDTVFTVIMAIAVLLIGAVCFLFYFIDEGQYWYFSFIPFAVLTLIVCLLISTRYELTEKGIIVKALFIRHTIKYESIRSVTRTKSLLSSMATSYKRLEIKTGDGFFQKEHISPVNEELFLEELSKKLKALGKNVEMPE